MTKQLNDHIITKRTPWLMLTYLFLLQLFIAFAGRSISPLGIVIGEDLGLSAAQIGMLPAALFLGQSIISILAGYGTDRLGSRKMMLFITLVLSTCFFLLPLLSTFIFILLLVIISGCAYGSSHPTTNRGIIDWFPINKRGTAMGIKQMAVTIGAALAAMLLLPLANNFGWQTALIVSGISLLFIGTLIFYLYKEVPQDNNIILTKHLQLKDVMSMFVHKALVVVTFSAVLLSGSQVILNTFIVIFAYEHLQLNIFLAGTLLAAAEIGGSFGRLSWGVISDTIFKGKRLIVLVIISIIVLITTVIVASLPINTPYVLVITIIFIFGFASNGFNGIWMNAATEVAEPHQAGLATGFSITFGSWGAVIFPPLFGFIVDVTDSFKIGWLFVSFLMLLAVASLLFLLFFDRKRTI